MLSLRFSLLCAASALALTACSGLPLKADPQTTRTTIYTAGPDGAPVSLTERMQGRKGLNVERLLKAEVENSIQDLSRIEQSIAAVRAGMMDVIPSLQRLEVLHGEVAALNTRLRSVMSDLNVSSLDQPMRAPEEAKTSIVETPAPASTPDPMMEKAKEMTREASAAPVAPAPAPKKAQAPRTPAPALKQGVHQVRIGDHAGKTRIVLDVMGEVKPVFDLDNGVGLLAIELPKTQWHTAVSQNYANGKLVTGYAMQALDESSLLAISLAGETQIMDHFVLKGTGSKPTRYVFDLKR